MACKRDCTGATACRQCTRTHAHTPRLVLLLPPRAPPRLCTATHAPPPATPVRLWARGGGVSGGPGQGRCCQAAGGAGEEGGGHAAVDGERGQALRRARECARAPLPVGAARALLPPPPPPPPVTTFGTPLALGERHASSVRRGGWLPHYSPRRAERRPQKSLPAPTPCARRAAYSTPSRYAVVAGWGPGRLWRYTRHGRGRRGPRSAGPRRGRSEYRGQRRRLARRLGAGGLRLCRRHARRRQTACVGTVLPTSPPPPTLTPTQPAAATGSTDECVVLRFEVANRREARALQLSSWALTVAISAAAVALVILRNESGEAEEGPCLRVAQSRPRCCCSSVLGTQRLAAHPRTTRFGTRRNLAWAQRAYC